MKPVHLFLSSLVFCLGLAQAQDAPPIVIRSTQHSGPQVWAQDRVGAPATNSTATLQAPSGGAGAAATVNATGSNVATNRTLVAQPTAMVVEGQVKCPIASKTWSASATCTASLPVTAAGSSAVATDSEVAVNAGRGSATYFCQADGNWAAAPTSSTCAAQCPATTLSWTVSGVTCSAAIGLGTSPSSATIVDSASPGTGQATFTCQSNATWSVPAGATCINNPPPGTYSSDYFIWQVYGRNAGDGDLSAAGGYTLADVDANPAVEYKLGLSMTVFTSVDPYPITKSGAYWVTGYGYSTVVSASNGINFAPQNCIYGTRAVRTEYYSASRISMPGWYCRSGYTP